MKVKTWISLILLATLVYLAHDRRPTLEAHQARLYLSITGAEAVTDESLYSRPEWADLELRDFFILTATQDARRNTLVSFGFGNYIKVVDEEWAKQAFGLELQPENR